MLLRDFDKREVVLIQKRQAKLDDRKEIMDKIGGFVWKRCGRCGHVKRDS